MKSLRDHKVIRTIFSYTLVCTSCAHYRIILICPLKSIFTILLTLANQSERKEFMPLGADAGSSWCSLLNWWFPSPGTMNMMEELLTCAPELRQCEDRKSVV